MILADRYPCLGNISCSAYIQAHQETGWIDPFNEAFNNFKEAYCSKGHATAGV